MARYISKINLLFQSKKTKIMAIFHKNKIRTLWKISLLPLTNLRWSTVVLLCRRITETIHQITLISSKGCLWMQAVVNLQVTSKTRSHNFSLLKNFRFHRTLFWTIWVVNHNWALTLQDRFHTNSQHYNVEVSNRKYHSANSLKVSNSRQNTHRRRVKTTDNNSFFLRSLFNLI